MIQAGTAEGQQFEAVHRDLYDHYQPVGRLEEQVLEKLATEYMRYCRLVEREDHILRNESTELDRKAEYNSETNPRAWPWDRQRLLRSFGAHL